MATFFTTTQKTCILRHTYLIILKVDIPPNRRHYPEAIPFLPILIQLVLVDGHSHYHLHIHTPPPAIVQPPRHQHTAVTPSLQTPVSPSHLIRRRTQVSTLGSFHHGLTIGTTKQKIRALHRPTSTPPYPSHILLAPRLIPAMTHIIMATAKTSYTLQIPMVLDPLATNPPEIWSLGVMTHETMVHPSTPL